MPSFHWTNCETGDAIKRISAANPNFNSTLDGAGRLIDRCSAQIVQQQNSSDSCSSTSSQSVFKTSWSGDCQSGKDIYGKMKEFEKCCDKTKVEDCLDSGLAAKP